MIAWLSRLARRVRLRWRAAADHLRHRLESRVTVSFLAFVLAVGGVAETLIYRQAADTVSQTAYDRLSSLSARRESDVHAWVKRQRDQLAFMATLAEVRTAAERLASQRPEGSDGAATRSELVRLLDRARRLGLNATDVEVIAAIGGRVLASTDSSATGEYRISDPYFTEGRRGPSIQKIYPSARTGRPMLTISAPLGRPGGPPAAVLAAHLDLQQLEELLPQSGTGYPVEFYLVNRFGEFVSASRFGRSEFRRGVHSAGITDALAGRRGIGRYRNYDGLPVMGAYVWLEDVELALMVELPEREAFAALRRMLLFQIITFLAAVTVLALGVRALARRVTQPIVLASAAAERLSRGDFTAEAPVTTADEVGALALAFNSMTSRLRTVYRDLEGQVLATRVALDALRQNEAMVHGIIDNSTTLVLVTDAEERCILVNRRFAELFARTREQCDGRPLRDVVPDASASLIEELLRTVAVSGRVADREWALETEEGVRTFVAACFPVHQGDGFPVTIGLIATDVTERRRAEDERREFEANVQHAQKLESLGVMAGGIAHDFNNILSAILTNATIGLAELHDPAEVRSALEQIAAASRRAADLTRQMLAYAGKGLARREAIDLHALITEMSTLSRLSVSKKVEFTMELVAGTPEIIGDPAQMSQVLLNLFINAGDAIGESGGRIVIHTERLPTLPEELLQHWMGEAPGGDSFVLLTVQDNGRGMDEATRQRIFEPFFTTKATGRGLGLSAVLGIVKGMGGALTVESAPRQGTRFTLAFRAAPAA